MHLFTQHRHYNIKKTLLPLIFSSLVSLFFASFITSKNLYYFKNLLRNTTIETTINRLFESLIRRNDQLAIHISNLNLPKTCRLVPVPEVIPVDMKTGFRTI